MSAGVWKLGDRVPITAQTQRFDTGIVAAADATPRYSVYEQALDTPIEQGFLKALGTATGAYATELVLATASGYENGKAYTVRIAATVNSVMGAMLEKFQIGAPVRVADFTELADKTLALNQLKILSDATAVWLQGTKEALAAKTTDPATFYAMFLSEGGAAIFNTFFEGLQIRGVAPEGAIIVRNTGTGPSISAPEGIVGEIRTPLGATANTAIATAIWNEARALHNVAGSFGHLVQTFGVTVATNNDKTGYTASTVSDKTGYSLATSPPSANDVADAVWDEVRSGHNVANSFGRLLQSDGVTVATNSDKTGYAIGAGGITTVSFAANAIAESVVGVGVLAAIVDKLLGRGVQGGSDGGRTVSEALFALRNRVLRATANATVFATDDTSAAWTATLGTTNVSSFITEVNPA